MAKPLHYTVLASTRTWDGTKLGNIRKTELAERIHDVLASMHCEPSQGRIVDGAIKRFAWMGYIYGGVHQQAVRAAINDDLRAIGREFDVKLSVYWSEADDLAIPQKALAPSGEALGNPYQGQYQAYAEAVA